MAYLWHMRTTLDIDDEMMKALLQRNPGASKKEAVERAIRDYLRRDAIEGIISLGGKIDFDPTYLEQLKEDELKGEENRWKKLWG